MTDILFAIFLQTFFSILSICPLFFRAQINSIPDTIPPKPIKAKEETPASAAMFPISVGWVSIFGLAAIADYKANYTSRNDNDGNDISNISPNTHCL